MRYIDQFGETGVFFGFDREHLKYPSAIAVAKDGSILVADNDNHRLVRLSED